ncbi:hypothetical protein BC939DRAFT_456019 [Gamsiella multidivaricata]|uniref:uncharacterized protein n=1 Tax=Gamsiella multidivaricata TaxID=101098 RepID=UPI00221FBDA0|nr:uncharacterized protein BC939DRAFT_456019 [Gamsiella multidivaricata]KAI7821184.1 hypothetical protein BC939DRAFT_456019 [Gamsiella multidivaricata]
MDMWPWKRNEIGRKVLLKRVVFFAPHTASAFPTSLPSFLPIVSNHSACFAHLRQDDNIDAMALRMVVWYTIPFENIRILRVFIF